MNQIEAENTTGYSGNYVGAYDSLGNACGNESYILPKEAGEATCGELKVNTPPITAFAVFEKDWKDPRDS